jgi:2-hydroxy-3-oxopropionate reductase
MQLKDMRIVMETAHQYGLYLPSAAGNTRLYEEMIELGMGELDNSAVIGVIEKLAGINLLD